jgi:hypothetical protein
MSKVAEASVLPVGGWMSGPLPSLRPHVLVAAVAAWFCNGEVHSDDIEEMMWTDDALHGSTP